MADKARDAFRTISEVANWLDIPAHVLRFWESKFPQIKPVKRAGGRRYYRPADMQLIGGIKKLLHDDGLTIRGVQKMLKEDGVKAVAKLSPALDMPSEEEGAARRQARRARRQARQDARQSERRTPKTPSLDEEDEAPFIHVDDSPVTPDNVVSIVADREALAEMTSADTDAEEASVQDADAAAAPGSDTAPNDPAPVADLPAAEEAAEEKEPQAEHDAPHTDVAEDTPVVTAAQSETPTPESEPEPEPEPAPTFEHEPAHAEGDAALTEPVSDPEPEHEAVAEPAQEPADVPVEDPEPPVQPISTIPEPQPVQEDVAEVEPELPMQPISTIPEPQPAMEDPAQPEQDEQSVEIASLNATDASEDVAQVIEVPADPNPDDVTLTAEQIAFAATVKRLRRATSPGADTDAARETALAKLSELRARMTSHLG
ncbi:MAG: MerR family transcriptional regulator [Pseudomonadota bacterium]